MQILKLIGGICVTVCIVSGCGSSPPVRYYALEPLPPGETAEDAKITIGIGPLRFPEYLKRPQIITRNAGSEITIAEFDRWVEAVDSALPRTVAMNLDGLLESVLVIAFPFGGGLVEVDYRILGQVVRFDVDQTGKAVLDVQWAILTADGNSIARPRRDRYQARATSAGDYSSIVAALNETVNAWSRDMVEVFRTALDEGD